MLGVGGRAERCDPSVDGMLWGVYGVRVGQTRLLGRYAVGGVSQRSGTGTRTLSTGGGPGSSGAERGEAQG